MLGVYLSIKTNSLTGMNISLFTVFDSSGPLSKNENVLGQHLITEYYRFQVHMGQAVPRLLCYESVHLSHNPCNPILFRNIR